jgi:hypothetical protein
MVQLYWGGGSVFLATSALDWHYWRQAPHSWEHGTLAFLDIIAIRHGKHLRSGLASCAASNCSQLVVDIMARLA